MTDKFLAKEELEELTGRKIKSLQIAQLDKMGIKHFVNASGHPVVPVSAIEGKKPADKPKDAPWVPKWANAA